MFDRTTIKQNCEPDEQIIISTLPALRGSKKTKHSKRSRANLQILAQFGKILARSHCDPTE